MRRASRLQVVSLLTTHRSICLWTTTRKKPIFTLPLAHGLDEHVSETEGMQKSARWITSLACLPYGDLFASGALGHTLYAGRSDSLAGSWDGFIRLWKLDRALRTFSPLFVLPAVGFVNSLHLSSAKTSKEVILAAALGQEPRLGRWMRKKEARNVALVVKLGPRS